MKQGNTVEWTSSANGTTKMKRGKIVAVVPANESPHNFTDGAAVPWPRISQVDPRSLSRNHESYIVSVPSKSGRGKPTIYWPRVSALRLVEDAETDNAN